MISLSMTQMVSMMMALASPAAALQMSVPMEDEEAGCPSKCKRGMWSWKECKDCHVQKCDNIEEGTPRAGFQEVPELPAYAAAVKGLDVSAVISDLQKVMKDSKD